MSLLSPSEQAVAKQWEAVCSAKKIADNQYAKVRREMRKLVRLAQLGRKKMVVVRISEARAVKIVNHFRGADDCFYKGFAKKITADEVKWDGEP